MSESAPEAGGAPGTGEPAADPAASAEGAAASGASGSEANGQQPADAEELSKQLDHWKQMARKNETRARENAAAAQRLQEIEDANKTELQKAVEAQQRAEAERDDALVNHSRIMAAAANNLPVELIDHLGGGTADEINDRARIFSDAIEKRAQEIVTENYQQAAGRNGMPMMGARPVESLRPGSAPAGGTPNNPEDWFRALVSDR
jgi:hypothetical protein